MPRRIALVHDYLVQDGGAERVLAVLQGLYPEAPTFTLVHDTDQKRTHLPFGGKDIRTSFLDKLPLARRHYQWYLPLMPMATEHLDLSDYDLIISSSSSFAKGVIAAPNAVHVCYCHTPTRFLWQERLDYLDELPTPAVIRAMLPAYLHRLRAWDSLAAERPDQILTNSRTSRERIRRYYRRDAEVIHPPVDMSRIPFSDAPGSYWLAGGRLVSYKRFDLLVRAFAELDQPLKIFGTGPAEKKLKRMATSNVEFMGHVDDAQKIELYRHAIAYLHPQIEDFGITAVEAMAAGRPVVAYAEGGARETVIPGTTGTLFHEQSAEGIRKAVLAFRQEDFDRKKIRAHAETFGIERFTRAFQSAVQGAIALHG